MTQNIIVVGAPEAGKTYLLNHLTKSYFEPFRTDVPYQPTIGVDLVGQTVRNNIKYVYWDSSGQERFIRITQPFLEKSDVVMIVFDLSSQNFQDLKQWYDRTNGSNKPTIIVGTKHDLVGEGSEAVLMAAVKFAQERECPFYPTSSVSGMGIVELRNALQRLVPNEEIVERAIHQQETSETRKKKQRARVHKQRFRKLFCCINGGYVTIPDPVQYPDTNLSVSV